jgi:Winged helix DNA-binding domain
VTLTPAALNRTILARQALLERVACSLPEMLERMGGIQAQYAPSMYVGLWSRVCGFTRAQLDAALVDRSVVQGTLFRATIHLVSTADYWPFAIAIRAARRAWWLRVQRAGATEPEMLALSNRAREAMAAGPVGHRELEDVAGRERLGGLHLFLDIVRVPPSGTWARRRANLYAAAEDWLGRAPPIAVADAVDHTVRRYLQAFGPATMKDIATWAGLPVADGRDACARLGAVAVNVGNELPAMVDLPGAEVVDGAVPVPVRFLPTWDAVLLAHARRATVVREEDRSRIFTSSNPQSLATFAVDGVVAGAWRVDGTAVVVDPFRPLTRAERRAVEAEAARLGAFHQ